MTSSAWYSAAGRLLGIASGATAAVLSLAFLWLTDRLATGTLLVFLWLGLLGLAGAWLAHHRRYLGLAGVFMVSFIPVGLYLCGAAGWLRLLGIATLAHGIAAALLWRGARP